MVLSTKKESILRFVDLLFYVSISIVAVLFKNQIVVGSIVNFILLMATFRLGLRYSIIVALFPSLISIAVSSLPLFLAPVVPFIITSNIILVSLFSFIRQKNIKLALVVGGFSKVLFLFVSAFFMFKIFLIDLSNSFVFTTFGLLQVITLVIGGGSFYFFQRFLSIKK